MSAKQYAAATEVVAEQLRRLADVGEALLLLLQPLADRAADGCGGCDHPAHPGRSCLADVLGSDSMPYTCGCRFDQ